MGTEQSSYLWSRKEQQLILDSCGAVLAIRCSAGLCGAGLWGGAVVIGDTEAIGKDLQIPGVAGS